MRGWTLREILKELIIETSGLSFSSVFWGNSNFISSLFLNFYFFKPKRKLSQELWNVLWFDRNRNSWNKLLDDWPWSDRVLNNSVWNENRTTLKWFDLWFNLVSSTDYCSNGRKVISFNFFTMFLIFLHAPLWSSF